jgi:hypothetical protein
MLLTHVEIIDELLKFDHYDHKVPNHNLADPDHNVMGNEHNEHGDRGVMEVNDIHNELDAMDLAE